MWTNVEGRLIDALVARAKAVNAAYQAAEREIPTPFHRGIPADGWACECDRCLPTRQAEQRQSDAVDAARRPHNPKVSAAMDAYYKASSKGLCKPFGEVYAEFQRRLPPHSLLS